MILNTEMSKLRHSLNGLKNAVENTIEIKWENGFWLTAFNTKTRLYIKSKLELIDFKLINIEGTQGFSKLIDSKIISIVNASDHTGNVSLKIEDTQILMTIGKSKFKLPIIEMALPTINMDATEKDKVDITILDLKEIEKYTGNFASTDRNKYILTGTNIANGFATATDSSIVARKKLENVNENISINVPQSSFKAILDTFDYFTTIYVVNNRMLVKRDDREMAFSLIEGQYPAVERLVAPQNAKNVIKFDRDHLTKKLNMLKLFTTKDNVAIKMEVSANEIKTKIAKQEIVIDCNSDWTGNIAISLDRFIKVVSKTSTQEIDLMIESNMKPLYIVENDLTMLLLPYNS